MANTIMSAKNSFLEGLIMDFAPDNTQATCMTSALNATLLTFNGNEMSLQNDMGNARVESAYLPEGYIPVGSCEFGDIIYIASYNPLTNKSQIGCFPSPERSISSEELHTTKLILSSKDFLKISGGKPTGELLSASVKKVLIDTKKVNPGDKYIIYDSNDAISSNFKCLSDFGYVPETTIPNEEHNNEQLKKNVKLHVVSIEDNGKITYLDTTTKWYKSGDYKYYIASMTTPSVDNVDIDDKRNLENSAWSIFSSKISGKLAILAELEMPETFSCTYELEYIEDITNDTIKYKKYKLHLLPEVEGLKYICIENSKFNNSSEEYDNYVYYKNVKGVRTRYKAININKDGTYDIEPSINLTGGENDFIVIPYQLRLSNKDEWENITSDSFIYTFDVIPATNYGKLETLKETLVIDFNKVGTGLVELNTWKYYNTEDSSKLKFGISSYPKPNWNVTKVEIEFYDAIGLAAKYILDDVKQYSGTFTEYLGLDGNSINYRLTKLKDSETIIYHKGDEIGTIKDVSGNIDNYVGDNGEAITTSYTGKVYLNDAGILYSKFLYAAKIIVYLQHEKYIKDDPVWGTDDYKNIQYQYRWFWTNSMFNEYYYSAQDFDKLNFELILNGEAIFETNQNYIWKLKEINNLNNELDEGTNSANIQYIGYGNNENNINMYIKAGLQNDYGCFNLILEGSDVEDKSDISTINLNINLGEAKINYSIPENLYEFSVKEETVSNPNYLALDNIVMSAPNVTILENFKNYLEDPTKLITEQEKAVDKFNIYYANGISGTYDNNFLTHKITLDKCYYISETNKASIPLAMQALLFNKAYTLSNTVGTVLVPVYTPIINLSTDLTELGIVELDDTGSKIKLAFDRAVVLCHNGNDFSGTMLSSNSGVFNNVEGGDDNDHKFNGSNRMIDVSSTADFLNKIWGAISPNIRTFFPVYFGGHKGDGGGTGHYSVIAGTSSNYIPTNPWKWKLGSTDKYKITEGSFDIDGSEIKRANTDNSVSFLGVKYKNGMTILNNAFRDIVYTDDQTKINSFAQKAINKDNYYDNFANLLYLLLTNTYHKNKKALDLKINLKNFVRNGDYDIELVKKIWIELSPTLEENNVILRNFDFKQYKKAVKARLTEDNANVIINDNNVKLKLLPFANEHTLTIRVKSLPMSFFNSDIEAYISRFGTLYPVSDLSSNAFYVYQNGELQLYQSNTNLIFPVEDVVESVKYIIDKNATGLSGAILKTSTQFTNDELGYNEYIDYIVRYIGIHEFMYDYDSRDEAFNGRDQYINDMYSSLPDSLHGYPKYIMLDALVTSSFFNQVFEITQHGNIYRFILHPENLEKKEGTPNTATHYEFTSLNFFNIFDYLSGFTTNMSQQLGSTFGAKDGGNNKDSAYTGFARDIILDTNYQVV